MSQRRREWNGEKRRKLSASRIFKLEAALNPGLAEKLKTFSAQPKPVAVTTGTTPRIHPVPRLSRQQAVLRAEALNKFKWKLPKIDSKQNEAKKRITDVFLSVLNLNKDARSSTLVPTSKSLTFPLNSLGEPFLRRPTTHAPTPVQQNGDLFTLILKGKELKPFAFKGDQLKAIQFYASHYPLLLRKLFDGYGSLPGSAKAITGNDVIDALRMTSAERRCQEINAWIVRLDECLRWFEIDPEDAGAIETVLRSESFTPNTWEWNIQKYHLPELN
ncbi:uncharacterized protein LOC131927759 [Physella acuta]|uniref:uncharacterized protein LOC131927759 n=1 Tax=Physella acuta TaxID=109671 RepID=UPI0027DCE04B|nr:uncharacterized protein LOC131927759 [Physella acuta]